MTTVPAARSCKPRRSAEMINGGSARDTRKARSSARGRPSGCTSSRTTAMRLTSCPKLPPASQDSTVDSTKNVAKIIHARQPLPVSTPVPKKPIAMIMHAAQSMINAPIRARQLASDPRPSGGRPRLWPGYASPAEVVPGELSATWPRLPGQGDRHGQVDRETDRRRVTCVKHLCNWMEIATPLGFRATDGGAYGPLSSSFCSVSSTPVLKAEQDVHLRAHGCVTTKRAQWHDRSHRRTDVPRSRRPVGLRQG